MCWGATKMERIAFLHNCCVNFAVFAQFVFVVRKWIFSYLFAPEMEAAVRWQLNADVVVRRLI